VSVRSRMSRLERTDAAADFDAFVLRWEECKDDRAVSAATDKLLNRMLDLEEATGHEITRADRLDDRWMESNGLVEALDRHIDAVNEAAGW